MLEFAPQCCDAEFYLRWARACAEGQCYDDLRPMGAQLWFSLPLRLGLAPEFIILGHWLLLVLSTLLGTAAIRRTLMLRQLSLKTSKTAALFALLFAVQAFVFWPVMPLMLADASAGLLALSGLWCLLLSQARSTASQALYLLVAGLLLGCAAWIRSFYLYPVLVTLVVYVLIWCVSRKRRWSELTLCAALLPIFLQYWATYQQHGQWSFISPAQSSSMFAEHLNSTQAGYDTLLPGKPHNYYPRCAYQSFMGGVFGGDLRGLACLLAARLEFYFVSDMRHTYIDERDSNNLFKYGEVLDVQGVWGLHHGAIEANAAVSPDGTPNAERIIRFANAAEPFELGFLFVAREAAPYTMSLWLWAEEPQALTLQIINRWTKKLERSETVELTPEPQRFQFSMPLEHAVHYFIITGQPDAREQAFYAWGVQLEQGNSASPYQFHRDVNQVRQHYPLLGVANGMAFMLALLALWRYRSKELLAGAFLFSLAFAEALIILPEQRFMVAVQVAIWALALLWVFGKIKQILSSRGRVHV